MPKLTRKQKRWCANYRNWTEFSVMKDDFLAGKETFEEMRRRNIQWYEDHVNDILIRISKEPE